jgi:hypothetical protein
MESEQLELLFTKRRQHMNIMDLYSKSREQN